MKIVEIDCKQVILSGITFNSSLSLYNPHQILAVMFQLESKPSYFEVEPERGMILHGDHKLIKIRIKPRLRDQARKIQKQRTTLILRATYYCEYNRKLLEKNRLGGWETISKHLQENFVPIFLNFDCQLQKVKDSPKNSMKNSRKQNSFEKFRDSSVKKVKDPKLKEDLDFIFRNEQFARNSREQKLCQHKEQENNRKILQTESILESSAEKVKKSDLLFKTTEKIEWSQALKSKKLLSKEDIVVNKNRSLQIILLAVLAAFSLGMGEVLGSYWKR